MVILNETIFLVDSQCKNGYKKFYMKKRPNLGRDGGVVRVWRVV